MTIGEDAAGQLADAALLGAAFERGGKGNQHHDGACANCGAPLEGRYCHMCGQRGHVHRSVLHLLEEFFHGLFHLDGKIIRTAPLLLFRPGALTRRYLEGQRVRFVTPIGMFLFTVFLMFFAVATIDADQVVHPDSAMSAQDRAKLKQDLEGAKQEIKNNLKGDPAAMGAVENALDKAEKAADQPVEEKKTETAKEDDDVEHMFEHPLGLDWRAISKKMSQKKGMTSLGPETEKRIRASLADPDLLVFKLRSAASEYSFLLVPASVPFLWLMFFWKRRVYLFDHVIFSLHSLSFMALFVTLVIVGLEFHVGGPLWSLAFLVPPIHMFFHLRGTYQLGTFGALWRTVALSFIAIVVLVCYVSAILILGLLH
ncbi:MAG TPA: DUF3667 domain-containing protein [Magnetospirillaceae bacterium]|nr:DUF3667 domain-containing protein [Magnetospirillaceae bacterium]